MTAEEFQAFTCSCVAALVEKQDRLARQFGIGSFARFWLDQPAGTLQFRDISERPLVEAIITPIGSFSANTRTWMWAWANQSIPLHLRQRSEVLRALTLVTGQPEFDTPSIEATEETAGDLTAIAVHHLGGTGFYSAPNRHLHLFVSLDEVHRLS